MNFERDFEFLRVIFFFFFLAFADNLWNRINQFHDVNDNWLRLLLFTILGVELSVDYIYQKFHLCGKARVRCAVYSRVPVQCNPKNLQDPNSVSRW